MTSQDLIESPDPKTRILNAASDLFLEGGAAALSVRAISKRAGLSTIGIYSHFQGKQGVLDALYIEGFALLTAALTPVDPDAAPRDAVLAVAHAYLDMAGAHEAHYRLIFGESHTTYSPSEEALAASLAVFRNLISRVAGLLPDCATRAQKVDAAMQVWALLHGFVSLRHHAVALKISEARWRASVIQAFTLHVDALMAAAGVA